MFKINVNLTAIRYRCNANLQMELICLFVKSGGSICVHVRCVPVAQAQKENETCDTGCRATFVGPQLNYVIAKLVYCGTDWLALWTRLLNIKSASIRIYLQVYLHKH